MNAAAAASAVAAATAAATAAVAVPMLLLLRVFGVVEVEIGLLPLPLRIKPHPSSVSRCVVVAAVLQGGCRIGTTCNKHSTKKVKERKKHTYYTVVRALFVLFCGVIVIVVVSIASKNFVSEMRNEKKNEHTWA